MRELYPPFARQLEYSSTTHEVRMSCYVKRGKVWFLVTQQGKMVNGKFVASEPPHEEPVR